MSIAVPSTNVASDTFQTWVENTNEAADVLSNYAVTATPTANGSSTTGNAHITGTFAALTLAASTIRGGNVQTTDGLLIVQSGNSTVNLYANSIVVSLRTSTVTMSVNATHLEIGNSTSNVFANSSVVSINGSNAATVANRSTVANNGSLIGSRSRVNFKAGTGVAITCTDDGAGNQINVDVSWAVSTYPAANVENQTLTPGATVNWNMEDGIVATVTLNSNSTIAAPTNLKIGSAVLIIKQDASGGRNVTWNSVFKWPGGVDPPTTTTADAIDVFSFICDGTNLYGTYATGMA